MAGVLVLGANGLLGSTLCKVLADSGLQVMRHGRGAGVDYQSDLRDAGRTQSMMQQAEPEVVINLVAATNVDECEKVPRIAQELNVTAVANITDSLRICDTHLIQISTDQVYSGAGPHDEASPEPVNVYGRTKLEGERLAEVRGATVLRCNFVGRSHAPNRRSFSDWVIACLESNEPATLFDDVEFSPLHMVDLSTAIRRAIEARLQGVFNLGCREGASKADFGMRLARKLGLENPHIRICSVAEKQMIAPRPNDMRMDSRRFEQDFQYRLPTFEETLIRTAKDYSNEH